MPATFYSQLPSPLGPLLLTASADAVTCIYLSPPERDDSWQPGETHPVLSAAADQLTAYFAGELRNFDLPLAPRGTPFQQQVWKELCHIPYGTTISYGELAARLGQPNASRAVGSANGSNPIAIVIPCHRVIGSTGKLTGYGGGLDRKRFLLQHESRHSGLFANS